MRSALLLLPITACVAHGDPPPQPAAPSTIAEATAPAPAATTGEAPITTSQGLYEQCKTRLERPESDNECATDDDCQRSGCSREVCTTRAHATEILTGCEILPCFDVLDTCACHDGRCTWTIRDTPQGRFLKPMKNLPIH